MKPTKREEVPVPYLDSYLTSYEHSWRNSIETIAVTTNVTKVPDNNQNDQMLNAHTPAFIPRQNEVLNSNSSTTTNINRTITSELSRFLLKKDLLFTNSVTN